MAIQTAQDRKDAIDLLRNDTTLTPQQQDKLMDGIEAFDIEAERQTTEEQIRATEQGQAEETENQAARLRAKSIYSGPAAVASKVGGGLQVAGTIATGAIAEVPAGLAGLVTLAYNKIRGRSNIAAAERASNVITAWQDALTLDPATETGQEMLEGFAAPIKKLDDAADWVSEKAGMGNPYAQAAIYTTLIGGTELLGLKGGGRVTAGTKLKRTQEIADRLGIDVSQSTIAGDIVKAAGDMTPNRRADNAQGLQEALVQVQQANRAELDAAVAAARETPASVRTRDVRTFAQETREGLLADGFDLAEMTQVQRRLDELSRLETHSPTAGRRAGAVAAEESLIELPVQVRQSIEQGTRARRASLAELDTIRNRMEKARRTVADDPNLPSTARESVALLKLEKGLDGFLDQQFHADMIDGSPEALARWNNSHQVRQSYNRRFNEDKAIVQLMQRKATPEQVHRWLLGASAAAAKPQAGAVIGRLKEILGKDHPAIEGIRQDFLYEIAAPLFDETPNFNRFISNYDKAVHNNPSLIKQLGLKQSDMTPLRNFAAGIARLPDVRKAMSLSDFTRAMSQFMVGHKIARASLRVNIFSNVLNILGGKHRTNKKAILADLAEAQFGGPVLAWDSVAAGRAIQASFLADISGKAEDEKVEQ